LKGGGSGIGQAVSGDGEKRRVVGEGTPREEGFLEESLLPAGGCPR